MVNLSSLLLIFLVISQGLQGASLPWVTDYKAALAASVKEKKPLLVFFSGSDWSGWSMKMKKEVLESAHFSDKMRNSFLFVEVDFPANSTLSEEIQKQNENLKRQFRISEYPRLLVVDEKERELARFGVENPETLTLELIELLDTKKTLEEAFTYLDKKSPQELEKLYNMATELKCDEEMNKILTIGISSSDPHFFLLERYRIFAEGGRQNDEVAKQIREKLVNLDPLNERKTHLSLALIDFQSRETASFDRREVIRPLEDYIEKFGEKDAENHWRLEMMVAQFYLNYDECVKALFHAELAAKLVPQDKQEEVDRTLNYIRKQAAIALKGDSSPPKSQ